MTTQHLNPNPLPAHAILSAEERAMLVAYMEEQTHQSQWPFDQAAKVTGLPAELLRKLVRDGVLTGDAPWRVQKLMGWCDINQARAIAAQLAAARRPVEGHGIPAYEAGTKYGFEPDSIYRWNKSGWVKSVDAGLFNEGDIAVARALADLSGHAPGKPVFPPKPRSGRPKKLRNE